MWSTVFDRAAAEKSLLGEDDVAAKKKDSAIAVQVDVTNSPAGKEVGRELASGEEVKNDSSSSRWLDKFPPLPSSTNLQEVLITKVTIVDRGEAIFHETATSVEIDDMAAGEFVKVQQTEPSAENGTITIDPGQWKLLREVIDAMVARCRS